MSLLDKYREEYYEPKPCKYSCREQLCGCPDCFACHLENFEDGVFVGEREDEE
jgi:hypothetical protein